MKHLPPFSVQSRAPLVITGKKIQLVLLLLGVTFLCAISIGAQALDTSMQGQGKLIFEQNCAVCHGMEGRADTPVSRLLTPRPLNFTDPIQIGRVTSDRMYQAVKEGMPGTAMGAWNKVLTELEIGDVVDYVRSFASAGKTAPLSAEKLSFEVGRRLYANDCAACHGESGKADTETAKVLKPQPTDFSDPVKMARVDDGRLYLAIFRGKPATSMGGWGSVLSPAEIIDLMRYVRTLVGPLQAGIQAGNLDFLVGKEIYQTYCITCHGEKGNGHTPLSRQLVPQPADFTATSGKDAKDDRQYAESIMHGINGTAMASWGGILNKEDVRRVIVFIRQSFSPGHSQPLQKSH